MNFLMIGGGVVAAGLAIVAAKQSYGPLMAGIQGIAAFALVFNGVLLAEEQPLSFTIAAALFLSITGYYFVPKLLWEFRLGSKNRTLQSDSDLSVTFGRTLTTDESNAVKSWLSVFEQDPGSISSRITTAPRLDAAKFAEGANNLCILKHDEVPIMHVRLWTAWPWQMWKSGILLTSRRMYLRAYGHPTRTIDYESARSAIGRLERDGWFTKLTLKTTWEEFDGIKASDLSERAEPFLDLLHDFLQRVH